MPIAIDTSPDWLRDLHANGYTVVKGVLAPDHAERYASEFYRWVEDFGLGFDRNDPATRTSDKITWNLVGGQINRYGVSHEQFVWDLKQEPAIIKVFEEIWGTDELLWLDGVNISFPLLDRDSDDEVYKLTPHVDQSPLEHDLHCVQGILNLLPNGPDDGGLMILKGSRALFAEVFRVFDDVKPPRGWNPKDRHNHTKEQVQWLYDQGCEWVKVCCGPGDLMLWDSRIVHAGSVPKPSSKQDRLAAYVCYKPAKLLTSEARDRRAEAWEKKMGTTHDPITGNNTTRIVNDLSHRTYLESVNRPLQNPKLTARGRKLVGLDPY